MPILREPVNIVDGISIFSPKIDSEHPDYNSKGLKLIHRAEGKHFWFKSRKLFILSIFKRYIKKSDKVLDIGSGTGNIAKAIIENGYDVSVGDLHVNGLEYAKQYGIKKCFQFDLFDTPFIEHFDTICMFDVLEHLDKDLIALQQLYKMLKNGGKCVLTVPAFMFLWSREDAYGHKRRYSINKLEKLSRIAGFKVLHARYIFSSILPLLLLRRFIDRDDGSPVNDIDYNRSIKIFPILNSFLYKLMQIESRLHFNLPNLPGGSIIIVLEKQNA